MTDSAFHHEGHMALQQGSEVFGTDLLEVTINGLVQVVERPAAVALVPYPHGAPPGAAPYRWVRSGVPQDMVDTVIDVVAGRLRAGKALGVIHPPLGSGWAVWAEPVPPPEGSANGSPAGALIVCRQRLTDWSRNELGAMRVFAGLCGTAWVRASVEASKAYEHNLDDLVARVSERLMPTTATNVQETLDWVIHTLAEFLHADTAFLRRNDHVANASVLVAEYPKRDLVPDPDPLAVVPFDVDPIFAALKDLKEPLVTRPSQSPEEYRERVKDASGELQVSGAAVPLVNGDVTEGCLGFLHFEDCEWTTPEVNALQAVAAMLVQLNARLEAEGRLQHIALHDDLTELPNRRALLAELDRRLAASEEEVALLFIDLDRFKVMNDYLGHVAGDRVLLTIADRIRTSIRPTDFAARLGGDEFVVLLEDAGGELGAMATANRLLDLIGQPIEVNGQQVSHTASVGIALARGGQATAVEMLGQADVALYAAKGGGGHRAVTFDESLRTAADERSDTELMLREAIDYGGLRLYYQPEFDLVTGRMLAVEALVRCEHPERGIVPAGAFISVAEETGLIVELGRWVLDEACRQTAIWRDQHPDVELIVRVNMSPAQLSMPGIVNYVKRCLRRSAVPGSALCLEITEHAVIQNVEQAVRILNDLHDLGVHLALDDFGTGFSSMAQLKRLPMDILKIDTSFVRGIAENQTDQAIVDSIVRLGEALGLDLVAEGVETPEDLHELLRLRCRRAQGFLLAVPMPAAELEPLMQRGGIDLSVVAPSPQVV